MFVLSGKTASWAAGGGGGSATFTETFSQANGTKIKDQSDWSRVSGINNGDIVTQDGVGVFSPDQGTYEWVRYNGNSGALAANQYVEIDVVTAPSSGNLIKLYLKETAVNRHYTLHCYPTGTEIWREGPSGSLKLAGPLTAVSNGDRVRLEYDGANVSFHLNGSLESSPADTDLNGLADGTAGLWLQGTTATVDNFECGNL